MIKGNQKRSGCNFVYKLYDILEKKQFEDTICWRDNFEQIQIKNIERMESDVLPKYFNHSNFSSFIRQLNMYNFHKNTTLQKNDHIYFKNSHFRRNDTESLSLIKRKRIDPNQPVVKVEEPSQNYQPIKCYNPQLVTSHLLEIKQILSGLVLKVKESETAKQIQKCLNCVENIQRHELISAMPDLYNQNNYMNPIFSLMTLPSIANLVAFQSRTSIEFPPEYKTEH